MLSIIVPVHNCARFLPDAVYSVTSQVTESMRDIELLIYDGGSSDNTEEIATELQQHIPYISYHRQEFKGGIDHDMHSAVALAKGSHCLLLSGDDTLREGGLAWCIEKVESGENDLYLSLHTSCNISMKSSGNYEILDNDGVLVCDLHSPEERVAYLDKAINTEAVFSFMSGLLFRKLVWMEGEVAPEHMTTCWGHVARFFEYSSRRSLRVEYTARLLIDKRGENDSFALSGLVKRIAITIDGLPRIFSDIFGKHSVEHLKMKELAAGDISLIYWLVAKSRTYSFPLTENRIEFDRLLKKAFEHCSLKMRLVWLIVLISPAVGLNFIKSIVK